MKEQPIHSLIGRCLGVGILAAAAFAGTAAAQPSLSDGLVSYWPLDDVVGTTTPDLVSGYDLELRNLTEADLIDGKTGKAFQFDNTRQTMLARVHSPGEQLPINQHPAFTISFWANVVGTGLNDLRMFSESSTTDNNPLFNIGTHTTGTDGTVDFYFRQTGFTEVNHIHSTGAPLDGTWHHLAFVQQEDGARTLYIDAVADPLQIMPKEAGDWRVTVTSIGGIFRANPSHWLTGMIDDVALWKRALSEAELTSVYQEGTPIPFSKPQPLAVRSFKADLPAVAVGDSVTLRWEVTKNVRVEIDRIGDVTAQTVAGLGSTEVTLSSTRTFTLTLRRGEETVSQPLTVYAIEGVADGWTLIDNFDRYAVGLLSDQGPWFDLEVVEFSIVDLNGNYLLAPNVGEAAAILPLNRLTVYEGQERTLFFRAYLTGDIYQALRGMVALTERRLRFGNEVTDNMGPGALVTDQEATGYRLVGGYVGWPSAVDFGPYEPEITPEKAWNIWVDIKNGPFEMNTADPPAAINTGDIYSIHVAEDQTAERFTMVSEQIASRNPIGQADLGFTTHDLDRLVVGALNGHSTVTNLYIDDIYLSKDGILSTVPCAFGYTTPVVEPEPPSMDVQLADGEITITWTSGVLESATSVTGPWSEVAGAPISPYKPPVEGEQRFFRARE